MGNLIDITKHINERKTAGCFIKGSEVVDKMDEVYSNQIAKNLDKQILAEIGLTPEEDNDR